MLLSHKFTMPQHTMTKQTPRKLLRNTETKQPQGQHWRYGVWIQLRRLEMSREASWCWVRANCPSAYPPNLSTNGWKTFHPWPKHSCLCHLDFPLQACLFSTKKTGPKSMCVFRPRTNNAMCSFQSWGRVFWPFRHPVNCVQNEE